MIYVIDTCVLSNYFKFNKFNSFPKFWFALEEMFISGMVVSVRESYKELESFFVASNKSDDDIVSKWLRSHKEFFKTPGEEECKVVTKIFSIKHFRRLIKEQSMILGSPEADAFVIAKAIDSNGVVVTNEKFKANASKIPNVCEKFSVNYIDGDEFAKIVNDFFDLNLKDQYYKTQRH